MTSQTTKCTAVTAKGIPCNAWAIQQSDPPRCAPHSRSTGAPKGNRNAVTHGFYQRRAAPDELNSLYDTAAGIDLTQEAILLRIVLHRLSDYLHDPDLPIEQVRSIAPLIVSGSRALAYIQKQLPNPSALDWNAALDELAEEWDWDI